MKTGSDDRNSGIRWPLRQRRCIRIGSTWLPGKKYAEEAEVEQSNSRSSYLNVARIWRDVARICRRHQPAFPCSCRALVFKVTICDLKSRQWPPPRILPGRSRRPPTRRHTSAVFLHGLRGAGCLKQLPKPMCQQFDGFPQRAELPGAVLPSGNSTAATSSSPASSRLISSGSVRSTAAVGRWGNFQSAPE